MTDAALSFSTAMQRLGLDHPAPRLAMGVSGGGDSVALALLAHEWAKGKGATLHAFTVDHGLRAESRAEAEQVAALMKQLGIAHDILTWQGDKPSSHVQERAREMRYKLLLDACRAKNITHLAVAHNAEDQMETFWMRLAHGSGLDGLAGMVASVSRDGVTIIRPLLGFTRAELRDICRDKNISYIDDPSNANEKYLRPRLRGFEDVLAGEGLTPQRLSQVLQKLGDAKDALEVYAARAFLKYARVGDAGDVTLDILIGAEPVDIQRRVLQQSLALAAPQDYPVPSDAVESLRLDILTPNFSGRTVAGCDVSPLAQAALFCREPAACLSSPLADGIWDGRFAVSGCPESASLTLGLLGEKGLAILRKDLAASPAVSDALEGLPPKARRSLPAIRQGENIVMVPSLSWVAPSAPEGLSGVRLSLIGR